MALTATKYICLPLSTSLSLSLSLHLHFHHGVVLFEQELLSVPKEREREQQISEAEDGGSGDSSAVNDSQHHPKTVPEKNEADIIIAPATTTHRKYHHRSTCFHYKCL